MSKTKYIVSSILLIILLLTLYFININYNLFIQNIFQYDGSIRLFIDNNLFFSTLFTLSVTLICIILFLPITPVVIIASFYLGSIYGFSVMYLGEVLGSSILYFFSGSIVKKKELIAKIKSDKFKKVINNIENNSFYYLIIIRIIGGIPFSLQSVLASISGMKYFSFLVATLIGVIPWLYIYINVGASIKNIVSINDFNLKDVIDTNIVIAITLIIMIFLLSVIIKQIKEYLR